ncbi:MAG TPA: glycosyltransferase family 4 protein [Ferruginibacter sp.]|nr:glycosyltransferase family 4 protein [Ferruginibacter sp.]
MLNPTPSVLFFTLKIFSATGGIEKVCKLAGKALYEIYGNHLQVYSMHDAAHDAKDNPYIPQKIYHAFAGNKIMASLKAIAAGRKKNIVILSHINLLAVGGIIKKINPKVKLILFTHGIEVWQPMSRKRKRLLYGCDRVISVSHFTRQKLIEIQGADAAKCIVLNNCLDPFLARPTPLQKPADLLQQYKLEKTDLILMTLTRLAITERHKGYDKVITAIAAVQKKYSTNIVYLLAGKYTDDERQFILNHASKEDVKVVLTGFVEDNEIPHYFALADMYIMPSKKEGFGITFIEAMYYGLPVIGGNADGSIDALDNGNFGLPVNPDSITEIENAIEKMIQNKAGYRVDGEKLLKKFGFETYKEKLGKLLMNI